MEVLALKDVRKANGKWPSYANNGQLQCRAEQRRKTSANVDRKNGSDGRASSTDCVA